MEVQLAQNHIDLIRKIAEEEGFTDYDISTTSGSAKGDNYMGVITTVSVKNHKKKLELILKTAINDDQLRKRAPIRKVYLREVYLYDTIFPEFEKFEKEQGFLDGFSAHPKLYGSSEEDLGECLVLENMKDAGYELWNRRVPMDEAHIELVFKEFAKFHAISFAMKEKRPEKFKKLCDNLYNIFGEMGSREENASAIRGTLKGGLEAVKGDQFATDTLKRFTTVAEKYLIEDLRISDETSVILHGDGWCNNMLFKYGDDEKKKPTKVCLIDWQISWVGSPALDLAYFLFLCAPKKILLDYSKYLKIYHDALSETLRSLNCDPEIVFPFDLLTAHWQKCAKYGIYIAIMLIKLMLGEGNEVPDLTEIVNSGKSFVEGFCFETVHDKIYRQRILDIVNVSGENNWI